MRSMHLFAATLLFSALLAGPATSRDWGVQVETANAGYPAVAICPAGDGDPIEFRARLVRPGSIGGPMIPDLNPSNVHWKIHPEWSPGLALCPGSPLTYSPDSGPDANGWFTWSIELKAGMNTYTPDFKLSSYVYMTCSENSQQYWGSFSSLRFAWFDLIGDLGVTVIDFGAFARYYDNGYPYDFHVDYNGDGIDTIADFGIFAEHYNTHDCSSGAASPTVLAEELVEQLLRPLPIADESWGSIKSLYR